jgi:DNA-binding MarR family transcriptional regulator
MFRWLTPSQTDILRALAQTPGITPEALAEATGLPIGGTGWNLSVLEKRGLVEDELIHVGGEVNAIYRLTPRGEEALRKIDR